MSVRLIAGALLALGILALTVGLICGESAGDLRTLTATSATSRMYLVLAVAGVPLAAAAAGGSSPGR